MKTALVTGANKGLGLEFVKQLNQRGYHVIGCCRHPKKAYELEQIGGEVYQLDITKDSDIQALKSNLKKRPIDLLINNAGITGEQGVTVGHVYRDNFLHVLNVNCVGAILLCDALLPNLLASNDKHILVMSSSMGSISENERGRSYAYRASKSALNSVMRSFAIDVKQKGVKVMLLHPGWVKTDLGGINAITDVDVSVKGMLTQMDNYIDISHAETVRRYDGGVIAW
ncbi:SDR family oxidoreductase [Legionella sp. W05-934-2]|uniref:SDR family oxidoreductase n=1 Tax=Legionella sp. W05-934-2 TaxID=1198649 RepID=UPI0034620BF5